VQQPEQVLAALLRKEPAARRAFCACNPKPPLTDRGATVDRAVEDRRQDGPVWMGASGRLVARVVPAWET